MENVFNIKEKDCINLVGAGGKTSLLFLLGELFPGALLTTTTKIFKPLTNQVLIDTLPDDFTNTVVIAKSQKENKLYGFNCEELAFYKPHFRYTFIEADGSRMLPLKGWSKNEPVLCDCSNKTIGVLDITVLTKESGKAVFRLDEYQKLTDDSGIVTIQNLVDIVLHQNGLFKGSKHKILYINKVESEDQVGDVKSLIQALKDDPRFDLDRIVSGSIFEKSFTVHFVKLAYFVLASGLSRRMGENKLLLPYKGQPLIEHVLSNLSLLPEQIFLITNGSAYDLLASKYQVTILQNKDYLEGQGSSIRAAAQIDVDEYAYFLGDMPNVKIESIIKLKEKKAKIKMLRSNQTTSAPLFISSAFRNELLLAKGDLGAKQVVRNHLNEVEYIDVSMEELFDVDVREDLK